MTVREQITKYRDKYLQSSDALRTSLWFTICNYLQRGTAIITVPIFTRILTTEEFGLCNIYFAWFEILIIFTSLKLPYEGLNNGMIRYEEDKDRYVSSIAGFVLLLTTVMIMAAWPFHRVIADVSGLNTIILVLMALNLLFNPALILWTNRKRFDFDYRLPVMVTLINTVLSPIIAIVAISFSSYHAEARILGPVSVQILSGFFCYFLIFHKGKLFYSKKYWKFAVGFNLPLIFYYLSQSVLNQADRIMIRAYEGGGKAGIYSLAYSIATLIQILISAINGSFHPWLLKKLKKNKKKEIEKIVLSLCACVALGTMAMTTFAPDIVRIMATKEYMEAIWIIPPVAASVFFVFLYMIFVNIEMYYDKRRWIPFISIAAAVANIGLNALFIPIFGYRAAGWTTLVCYILVALLHWYCVKGVLSGESKIALIVLLELIGTVLMMGTYRLGLLRYLVIALELICVFFFRKKLLHIWQGLK